MNTVTPLRTDAAAAALGMHPVDLRYITHRGMVPVERGPRGVYLFDPDVIAKIIDRERDYPPPPPPGPRPQHGVYLGYRRHISAGEVPCADCIRANDRRREHQSARQRVRRAGGVATTRA